MKIVIVAPENGLLKRKYSPLADVLCAQGHTCAGIFRNANDQRNIMSDIRELEPDLLVTEDLEGFEMCTLTDAVSYNLVHCRQLHFILSDDLPNERYLSKQLSLLMTFICNDAESAEQYRRRYIDIPEIISVSDDLGADGSDISDVYRRIILTGGLKGASS